MNQPKPSLSSDDIKLLIAIVVVMTLGFGAWVLLPFIGVGLAVAVAWIIIYEYRRDPGDDEEDDL